MGLREILIQISFLYLQMFPGRCYLLFTRMYQLMFSGTPYSHDALGTDSSFNNTDAALLQKFYSRWYVPNNAILVNAFVKNGKRSHGFRCNFNSPFPYLTFPILAQYLIFSSGFNCKPGGHHAMFQPDSQKTPARLPGKKLLLKIKSRHIISYPRNVSKYCRENK